MKLEDVLAAKCDMNKTPEGRENLKRKKKNLRDLANLIRPIPMGPDWYFRQMVLLQSNLIDLEDRVSSMLDEMIKSR